MTFGDRTLATAQDGLVVNSSQSMTISVTSDVLMHALTAVVNGRYGASIPLFPVSTSAIRIFELGLKPRDSQFSELTMRISRRGGPTLTVADLQNLPEPILSANGVRIPYQPALSDATDDPKGVLLRVTVPSSLLHKDDRISVVFPLLGYGWSQDTVVYDDADIQVSRIGGGPKTTLLLSKRSTPFNPKWEVILDKRYNPAKSTDSAPAGLVEVSCISKACYALEVIADTKLLASYKKLLVVTDSGFVQAFDIPESTSPSEPSEPAKLTPGSPPSVELNESVTVKFKGSGLDGIKQVSFEGKQLSFSVQGKGTELDVLLTRDVTSKEGHQELLLQSDGKTLLTATILVLSTAKTSQPKSQ